MSKRNIFIIGGCAVVVVVGLVLGLTLGGSSSGQTPGKKVMSDTKAYLMEMQRLLDDRGHLDAPQICYCCDTPMVNGECPYCRGGCEKTEASGMKRVDTITNAPVSEVETGGDTGEGGGDSGGGNCSC